MHVISRRPLIDFSSVHRDAEAPLRAWHSVCEGNDYENFSHLRRVFPNADKVGKFTVFNIGGNKYRLITVIHYNRRKIYVRHVLTHEDYDRGRWKRE
jgi:mRNA interferase HigB